MDKATRDAAVILLQLVPPISALTHEQCKAVYAIQDAIKAADEADTQAQEHEEFMTERAQTSNFIPDGQTIRDLTDEIVAISAEARATRDALTKSKAAVLALQDRVQVAKEVQVDSVRLAKKFQQERDEAYDALTGLRAEVKDLKEKWNRAQGNLAYTKTQAQRDYEQISDLRDGLNYWSGQCTDWKNKYEELAKIINQ